MSINNLDKVISYLIPVSKSPITVDGKTYHKPVNNIHLGTTFFNSDGCEICGSCCVFEDNLFTQSEYDYMQKMTDEEFRAEGFIFGPEGFDVEPFHRLKAGLKEEKHIVNGKEISVYTYTGDCVRVYLEKRPTQDKVRDRCTWSVIHNDRQPNQTVTCGIHPVSSITCKMPHLRFLHSKTGSVNMELLQYGRNFIINCNIKFLEPTNEAQFEENKKSRLDKLRLLQKCGEDMNVTETYLPEVIEYVENTTFENYKDRLMINILDPNSAMHTKRAEKATVKLKHLFDI